MQMQQAPILQAFCFAFGKGASVEVVDQVGKIIWMIFRKMHLSILCFFEVASECLGEEFTTVAKKFLVDYEFFPLGPNVESDDSTAQNPAMARS